MACIIKLFDNEEQQIEYQKTQNYNSTDIVLFANKSNRNVVYTSDLKCNQKTIINTSNNDKYIDFSGADLIQFNILPSDIDSVQVIDIRRNTVIKTFNKKLIDEQPLYKIGLVSDVHYNDNDITDMDPDTIGSIGSTEYSEDLKNALTVFNNEHVDFISCSGDISTDDINHARNFTYCFNKYGNNIPFYTCVGNHDTVLKHNHKAEWMQIDNLNDKYGIVRFESSDNTSFYFVKELDETHKDVYIYLNLEYGWEDGHYNTHSCRKLTEDELLTKNTVESDDIHIYNPDTLTELANILEMFKNDRCFIFTHIMFSNCAGTYHGDLFYNYYKDHSDVLRGDQGDYLYNLLSTYNNNYWFCGHSHYKWNWQILDKNMNVVKVNNSYHIHLPSLAVPLKYGIKSYNTASKDSEGAIMDVYKDYIVLKGYVFKEYDYPKTNNHLVNYNGHMTQLTADDLVTSSSNIIINTIDDKIDITINKTSSDIVVNLSGNDTDNYKLHDVVLRFSDVKIFDENENDITEEALEEHKIGFRDHTSTEDYLYYFEDNHIYTLDYNGVILKLSSGSRFINQKIHIQFNCQYGFVPTTDNYQNKINPIAIYKI